MDNPDLKMSYQSSESDEIIDLDFIKNKTVSYIKVPLVDGKIYKSKDFKFLVGEEFVKYLNSGKTTIL